MANYRHYNPYRKQQRLLLLLLLILMVSLLAWKSMETHLSTHIAERRKYADSTHNLDDVLNRSDTRYLIDNENLIAEYHISLHIGEAGVISSDNDQLLAEEYVEDSDDDPGKNEDDVDIFGADSHLSSAGKTLSNVDFNLSNVVNKTDIDGNVKQPYNFRVNSSDASQTKVDFREKDGNENVSQSDVLFQEKHMNNGQSDIAFHVNDTNLRDDAIDVKSRDVNQAQVQVNYENVNQQQLMKINNGDAADFQIKDGYANEPDADLMVNNNGDINKPNAGLHVNNDDVKRFDDDVLPLINVMP